MPIATAISATSFTWHNTVAADKTLTWVAVQMTAPTPYQPYAEAAGELYGGASSTAVTFPAGRFNTVPILVLTNKDGGYLPIATVETATGFTYHNTVGANQTLTWTAVQMTPTQPIG
jgi:hypothetical protein